jgi:hypothetical protein
MEVRGNIPMYNTIVTFSWQWWEKPLKASVRITGFSPRFEPSTFLIQSNIADLFTMTLSSLQEGWW